MRRIVGGVAVGVSFILGATIYSYDPGMTVGATPGITPAPLVMLFAPEPSSPGTTANAFAAHPVSRFERSLVATALKHRFHIWIYCQALFSTEELR